MSKFGCEKSVPFVCVNCHTEIEGIKDENGKTKVKCPYCGTVTVSQIKSRRHIQIDVYAPQGQSVIT